jgi:hypothetical protein
MEGNAIYPKAMLIFLLCHLQGHPLCSNAPLTGSHCSNATGKRAQGPQAGPQRGLPPIAICPASTQGASAHRVVLPTGCATMAPS